ncbi:Os10g0574750 [Oryza sativa Japonica Group]|uniref:Os10g0574750 protein n=1 Tax=Oryza sativa subsp. japonica TaxID=39947 RepID=A0A0P0XXN4_ORYSJ|nr:hypothetical protein EE612_052942 [Oryza sativa]BAT12187.1 Os10g0574750 [Oryza sativa Japonica Group]
MRLPNGARCGMPLRRLGGRVGGGGGVDGVKLLLAGEVELSESEVEAMAWAWRSLFLLAAVAVAVAAAVAAWGEQPTTLQPREQKRKLSRRLRLQTSQMLATAPLPALCWGRSLRNTTRALLMTYVCTPPMSMNLWMSDTLITSWYDDRRICNHNAATAMVR